MGKQSFAKFGDQATRRTLSDLLLSCQGAGAWLWELPTNTVKWSSEVYRIFESPDFDNTLESFRAMVVPEDMESGFAALSRALMNRETFQTQFRIKTPKGQHRRLLNTGRALYDKAGKPKMVVGLVAQVEQIVSSDQPSTEAISTSSVIAHRDLEDLQALHEHFLHVRSQPDAAASIETDQKVVAFILARIMPHSAAVQLAGALLKKFNTFAAILSADQVRLKEVEGIEDQHIKLLHVTQYAMESALQPGREPLKFDHPDTLINYLHATHAYLETEQLRVIFLNNAHHLIANEIMQHGTVDQTPIFAREIVKRALELSATAIILIHNHPSGNPTPSLADIDQTNRIKRLSTGLGIEVRDHIILGRYGHISFRRSGLLH